MNVLKHGLVASLLFSIGAAPSFAGVSKDVSALLNAMPGNLPLAVVIPNAEDFDARLAEAVKQLDPSADSPGLVNQLKQKIKLAGWVDFSKPVGLAQADFSNDETALIFAVASDFDAKAKALNNAKQEEGVWQLPFDASTTVYAAKRGPFVVASKSKESLQVVLNERSKLSDNIKNRSSMLEGKQLFAEINIEPVRAIALGGIMQISAFAPMLAMSAASDGSADPATISGLVTAGTEGLQKLVQQVAFVDIALGIKKGAIDATIQPTFNEGPIAQYLAAQQAGTEFLKGINTDSYMVAFSWQFPGTASPFFDYLFSKMEAAAAMSSPIAMGQPKGGGNPKATSSAKLAETKESLAAARKLYGAVQSMNSVFSITPKGMLITGDYSGGNPQQLLQLASDSFGKSNPISKMFGGGASYQASGSRKIGDVEVKEFAITLDPGKSQTAKAAAMYGAKARFTMGVVGKSVRYCVGPQEAADAYFKKTENATLDPGVASLLKNFPAKKNIVVAVNSAGLMTMLGPMLGHGAAPNTTGNVPLMGLSLLMSGEARLDLHVPFAALKPLMNRGAASTSGGPM